MKPIRLILALCSLAVAAAASAQPDTRFNRAPLQPRPYAELPIGAVKPAGWLNEQLVRMHDGMTGHLDSLYPQVMGPRNGWLRRRRRRGSAVPTGSTACCRWPTFSKTGG